MSDRTLTVYIKMSVMVLARLTTKCAHYGYMTQPAVRQLWRYPVKSMGGEEAAELTVGPGNVDGDRAYGFVETDTGRLVSAKRYGALLQCRARLLPAAGVEVTFPDGTTVDDIDELTRRVSALIGHDVRLVNADDPDAADVVAWGAPETLADFAPLHLLAVTDLDRLADEHPESEWDVRRFRPNVLIDDANPLVGGDGWIGCDLHLGAEVVAHAVILTPRCVMTTRPQGQLRRDRDILRTLARARSRVVRAFGNSPCLGCYAEVVHPGVVRRGDPVRIERVDPRHGVLAKAVDAVAATQN